MSPITELTKQQYVTQLLTTPRDLLLGDRPSAAEEVASGLCGGWFAVAPPEMVAMSDHPWGRWPNAPVLRDLQDCFDVAEAHADAALSLVRVLVSMFPGAAEPEHLGAELELQLTSAGATAPDWSVQLDEWRPVQAMQVLAPREGADFDDILLHILEFEHPCGDRHGLALALDHCSCAHVDAIDVFDDVEDFVAEVREAVAGAAADGVRLESVEPRAQYDPITRSVKKTYGHDFRPLRSDIESLDLFTLVMRRTDCLVRRAAAAVSREAGAARC